MNVVVEAAKSLEDKKERVTLSPYLSQIQDFCIIKMSRVSVLPWESRNLKRFQD